MTEYAFPKDLLDGIRTRWQSVPDQRFVLPEDHVLRRLLETCYHASFRTSEQRTVRCVVAYASVTDILEGALRFSRPVVLTDSELVRLSPVTKHRQTVIGCEKKDGWLQIWGFFDYGHAWVQHSAGDPPAVPIELADFPPDCLTVTIEAPGALTVSRGRTALVSRSMNDSHTSPTPLLSMLVSPRKLSRTRASMIYFASFAPNQTPTLN